MKNALTRLGRWLAARARIEKAAVVGFAVTAAWWLNDVITSGDWSDWRTLIPLATALAVRVFVTSEDVKPGWRRQKG